MPDRGTYLLFYVLLTTQLIFALISWYLIYQSEGTVMMSSWQADLYLPALVIVLSGIAAWFIDSSRARQAQRFVTPENSVAHYRTTVLLRSAIVQSGNLLALSMAVITKRLDLLALVLVGLLLYMYFRPSTSQFRERYSGEN